MKDRINDLAETSMIMASVFKHNEEPVATPTVTAHIDKVLTFQHCPCNLLQDITDVSLSYNHSVFLNGTVCIVLLHVLWYYIICA